MRDSLKRQIVVEYDIKRIPNPQSGSLQLKPILKRIVSWTNKNGKMSWKEISCPQKTFFGINGYYETLRVPVVFYNRSSKQWMEHPPN